MSGKLESHLPIYPGGALSKRAINPWPRTEFDSLINIPRRRKPLPLQVWPHSILGNKYPRTAMRLTRYPSDGRPPPPRKFDGLTHVLLQESSEPKANISVNHGGGGVCEGGGDLCI